jgi:hypothetical protein
MDWGASLKVFEIGHPRFGIGRHAGRRLRLGALSLGFPFLIWGVLGSIFAGTVCLDSPGPAGGRALDI